MAKNLIKNGQNSCFLKTSWPKSQIFKLWLFPWYSLVSQIVCKAVYFCRKKCSFAKEASFYPKTTISAI